MPRITRPGHRGRAVQFGYRPTSVTAARTLDHHAHRHRSRRHQNRSDRARPRRRASVSATRADAARRLRRRRSRPSPHWSSRPSRPRRLGSVGIGMPGRDFAGDRPRQERQLDLAERPAARPTIWSTRLARPSAWPTTRTASRCPKRPTARRPGHDVVFGVIIGTGTGGGVVVERTGRRRRKRDRGGVGAQPDAVAGCRRVARPALLLRPHRMHRDVSVGSGAGARSRAGTRRAARCA